MAIITKNEMLKEVKKEARKVGLVFRKSELSNLFVFHDFKTKAIILKYVSIDTAYEDVLSGYIASYNKDSQKFFYDAQQNYFINNL